MNKKTRIQNKTLTRDSSVPSSGLSGRLLAPHPKDSKRSAGSPAAQAAVPLGARSEWKAALPNRGIQ